MSTGARAGALAAARPIQAFLQALIDAERVTPALLLVGDDFVQLPVYLRTDYQTKWPVFSVTYEIT